MLMALEEFTLSVAAINAVMVVPMLAPSINGAAFRKVIIFCATIGTTTDVVIVLERMAAVVRRPQKNDFHVFLKKNRLKRSGELAISNREISCLNNTMERNNKPNDNTASTKPLGIIRIKKSTTGVKPDHPVGMDSACIRGRFKKRCVMYSEVSDKKRK